MLKVNFKIMKGCLGCFMVIKIGEILEYSLVGWEKGN